MATYKLYIDVLYAVSSAVEAEIEIEAFGNQQFELLENQQVNMSDTITLEADNPLEAISKAQGMVKQQYTANHHIGYYRIVDGSHGYLDVQQYQASHIHFADEEMDEEYEDLLEEINAEYYDLIAA